MLSKSDRLWIGNTKIEPGIILYFVKVKDRKTTQHHCILPIKFPWNDYFFETSIPSGNDYRLRVPLLVKRKFARENGCVLLTGHAEITTNTTWKSQENVFRKNFSVKKGSELNKPQYTFANSSLAMSWTYNRNWRTRSSHLEVVMDDILDYSLSSLSNTSWNLTTSKIYHPLLKRKYSSIKTKEVAYLYIRHWKHFSLEIILIYPVIYINEW